MKTVHTKHELKTKEAYQFIDVTDDIISFVEGSGIKNGIVNIQIMHTSSALILNENEPLLLKDIKERLDKIAPMNDDYSHDNFEIRTVNMCDDECANGHSHCKAIGLPSTITLNLIEGKMQLGQWQKIMFLELDCSRTRYYQVLVLGE
jgi:secondary thiamine-phosphate synthase enzyme